MSLSLVVVPIDGVDPGVMFRLRTSGDHYRRRDSLTRDQAILLDTVLPVRALLRPSYGLRAACSVRLALRSGLPGPGRFMKRSPRSPDHATAPAIAGRKAVIVSFRQLVKERRADSFVILLVVVGIPV